MCPWPRFQAALLDQDSYVVSYQKWRGEPRAPLKKSADWAGRGDCIACNQCVAVCPMGIDIRDGLQLECIGCGLCIDACNDVMARIGRPPELITLDTERNQELRAAGASPVRRFVRPRTIVYAAILVLIGSGMLIGLSARAAVDVNVLHDRNPLFVTLSDGSIRNGYTVKILNKSREPQVYELSVAGLEGATLSVVGEARAGPTELAARPDAVTTYRVHVSAPRAALDGEAEDLMMILTDRASGATARHETVFRGPE
ncbi:MAG: fixG [Geminicoccaceae bacterium]|nr:fixG [Geminicoccaceae bacterium]